MFNRFPPSFLFPRGNTIFLNHSASSFFLPGGGSGVAILQDIVFFFFSLLAGGQGALFLDLTLPPPRKVPPLRGAWVPSRLPRMDRSPPGGTPFFFPFPL